MNKKQNKQLDQNNVQTSDIPNIVQLKYKIDQQEYYKVNRDLFKTPNNQKENKHYDNNKNEEIDKIFRDFKEKEEHVKKEIENALKISLSNSKSVKKQNEDTLNQNLSQINRNYLPRNESRNKDRPNSSLGTQNKSPHVVQKDIINFSNIQDKSPKETITFDEDQVKDFQIQQNHIQFIKKRQSNKVKQNQINFLNQSFENKLCFQDITDQIRNNNYLYNDKNQKQNNPATTCKIQELNVDKLKQKVSNIEPIKSQIKSLDNKKEQFRMQSANIQTKQNKNEAQRNIISNRITLKRMESPMIIQNNNNDSYISNKAIQQSNLKQKRPLHISDYSSLNNTLTLNDKQNNLKTPNQTSPTQIGLEKRKLKTLNDYSTSFLTEDYNNFNVANRQKTVNNVSQKSSDTPEKPRILLTESQEGVFQLHDNLVNFQKTKNQKYDNRQFSTIQYSQRKTTNNNYKDAKVNLFQDSSHKISENSHKESRQRNKTSDCRIEQISNYVKPMLQYQADICWQTQYSSFNINNNYVKINNSHTLDPLTTTEDSESKKKQISHSSYKKKNKCYINNNFNYQLKILRGTLKKNQLSPENILSQKFNIELPKENSIIIEENPSQYNLQSQRNTSNSNKEKLDSTEQQIEENKLKGKDHRNSSASPQQNSRNKEVLKKFLTKTKQIKSKNFIENLETDNTCADDSCQEQMNTVDDFKAVYPASNYDEIQNSSQQNNFRGQSGSNQIKKQSKLQPLQQIQNQSYYHAQNQLIQEAKQNKKNALRSSYSQQKEEGDDNGGNQKSNVKQIYNKLNQISKNSTQEKNNNQSNSQTQKFNKGSPVSLRDSLNANYSYSNDNNKRNSINQEGNTLSRDEQEIIKYQEEKRKLEKQKFAPYKVDQFQQFVNNQNVLSQSSKYSNLQQPSQQSQIQNSIHQNSSDYSNHQRYSFSFQYQQNIQQSPSQTYQQQISQQSSQPSQVNTNPSIVTLKSIHGPKVLRQMPYGVNDAYYGMPVPANFGISTMEQHSSHENFSPHFSQQFQEQNEFKKQQQNNIQEIQSFGQHKLISQEGEMKDTKQIQEQQAGRISQMGDSCPPAPTKITLEYLQMKNETEDSYRTAFYNNQVYVQQTVKENFYGNSQHFQQKMQAVILSTNQQNKNVNQQQNDQKEQTQQVNEKIIKKVEFKDADKKEDEEIII
ncbi:hypothetical protein TTHERM_00348920 (macronuclear) [Tetrahymena thermophila SB210]|uniref:Uncharacterized protein n=1 Tax=Tetrahymena thermophila (strain SB210) TaxID=312017 RepID=I7LWT2_TETTS|nr:hypothetical protein TTHERM_00348920 [Tetrahymena thermophila SB210]EAS02802.1 hypothetical protein TTHERM_00348920 [Tetrahymena thermophila SB210]|eukprot:XP_001023047.1 hypothetical protein TTHERM_00348920 [Tetrahymena thermophila SB210]